MSFFRVRNINSDNTLQQSLYQLNNNLITTKVLTDADVSNGINYNVSNNTFYTSNFGANFDWSALGTGLGGTCNSIAIDSKGNVYIGGNFTTAGGVSANNIVRWDGSNWYQLGDGLDNGCYSITIDSNDNVYAGGSFTTAGGVSVNNIAKWSPSTGVWSTLGSGLNGTCNSIAIDSNDNVYVGGQFTSAGGITGTDYIAKWSPSTSTWLPLETGLGYTCYSVAIDSNDNVYAGGDFVKNIAYYSNQTYMNLVYNSRKLKTIRGPADSTLVFVNSDTNKAFNIDIS